MNHLQETSLRLVRKEAKEQRRKNTASSWRAKFRQILALARKPKR